VQAVLATQFGDPTVLKVVDLPDPVPGPGEIAIDVTQAAVGLIDVILRQGCTRTGRGCPSRRSFRVSRSRARCARSATASPALLPASTWCPCRAPAPGGTPLSTLVPRISSPRPRATTSTPHWSSRCPTRRWPTSRSPAFSTSPKARASSCTGRWALPGGLPGIARQLGATRVVGTVRASKLAAAAATRLPYDQIVDSADLPGALGDEKFDVVIDAVGGEVRTRSLDLMKPGGRLLACGNASGDWGHQIDSNQLWLRSIAVSGFSSGAYLPAHPQLVRPALQAALKAAAAGLGETEVDVLPFSEAVTAHQRMESRDLDGRIVLTPGVSRYAGLTGSRRR